MDTMVAVNAPTWSHAVLPPTSRTPASSSPAERRTGPWPPSIQASLAFILGIFAVLLANAAWHRLRSGAGPATPAGVASELVANASYRVDLNTADAAELAELPGIGWSLAEAIIRHRPFESMDQVTAVPGIGPVLLEQMRPHVYVSQPTDTSALGRSSLGQAKSLTQARRHSKKPPPTESIDLNTASREELMKLPGIGPVLADRIIADRTRRGPYRAVDEIVRVRGIGPKRLEGLRPYARTRPIGRAQNPG